MTKMLYSKIHYQHAFKPSQALSLTHEAWLKCTLAAANSRLVHAQATYVLYTGIPLQAGRPKSAEHLIVGVTVEGLNASMVVQVCSGSRRFVKTGFFFKAGEQPDNYQQVSFLTGWYVAFNSQCIAVGITACVVLWTTHCYPLLPTVTHCYPLLTPLVSNTADWVKDCCS